jgi:hypothetical protein
VRDYLRSQQPGNQASYVGPLTHQPGVFVLAVWRTWLWRERVHTYRTTAAYIAHRCAPNAEGAQESCGYDVICSWWVLSMLPIPDANSLLV